MATAPSPGSPAAAPLPSAAWRLRAMRTAIVALTFLGTFIAYSERTGFSAVFTLMAGEAQLPQSSKGVVLSAFYWGYALTQIPAGMVVKRVGGGTMMLTCFTFWAGCAALAPGSPSAPLSWFWLNRFGVGASQGLLFPAIHTILAKWIAPAQRSLAVSLTTSGMYLGSAFSMIFHPAVQASLGSASAIRIGGIFGLLWVLPWMSLRLDANESLIQKGSERLGDEHQSLLSAVEKGTANGAGDVVDSQHKMNGSKGGKVPWNNLVSSTAIWAIIANNFAFHYTYYVLSSWIPTYFEEAIGEKMAKNKIASMAPYVLMFLAANGGGWVGDWLIARRQGGGIAAARKIVNSVGMAGAALGLLIIPNSRNAATCSMTASLALGFAAFSRGGWALNHMDIAPKYAGLIMGIANTAGTVAGALGVNITGMLLSSGGGSSNPQAWVRVFSFPSVLCLVMATIFIRFAKGTRMFQ